MPLQQNTSLNVPRSRPCPDDDFDDSSPPWVPWGVEMLMRVDLRSRNERVERVERVDCYVNLVDLREKESRYLFTHISLSC
jgi:hypothetical protein